MQILLVGIIWALCVLSSLKGWYRILIAIVALFYKPLRVYCKKQWVADDQDINALFNGNEDHTISGRVGYMSNVKKTKDWITAKKIINALFRDPNHCDNAIEYDEISKGK